MILGFVRGYSEPVVTLEVRGPAGVVLVEFLLDTGFTGSLALPSATIQFLGLPKGPQGRATIADGSEWLYDQYHAEVLWDGRWRIVLVCETQDIALLGLGLLVRHRLTIDFVPNGPVEITPLP